MFLLELIQSRILKEVKDQILLGLWTCRGPLSKPHYNPGPWSNKPSYSRFRAQVKISRQRDVTEFCHRPNRYNLVDIQHPLTHSLNN